MPAKVKGKIGPAVIITLKTSAYISENNLNHPTLSRTPTDTQLLRLFVCFHYPLGHLLIVDFIHRNIFYTDGV